MQSRFSLVAVVLVAAACGDDSSGTAPAAGDGPVGQVVQISGQVTARRASAEQRRLTIAADVFGDDEVTTGPDSTVAIALHHNGAVWELAGSQSRRVDASAAWRAPKGSSSGSVLAGTQANRTAAAGRQAEPSADDRVPKAPEPTAAVGPAAEMEEAAGESAPDPAPAAAAAPPPPPPASAPKRGKSRASKGRSFGSTDTAVPKSLDGIGGAPGAPGSNADTVGSGLGLRGVGVGGGGGGAGGAGVGAPGGYGAGATSAPKPAPKPARLQLGKPTVTGPLDAAVVARVLRSQQAGIRYCYERALTANPKAAGQVRVTLRVTAEGRVSKADIENKTGASEMFGCLGARFRRIKFPAAEGASTITVTMIFSL